MYLKRNGAWGRTKRIALRTNGSYIPIRMLYLRTGGSWVLSAKFDGTNLFTAGRTVVGDYEYRGYTTRFAPENPNFGSTILGDNKFYFDDPVTIEVSEAWHTGTGSYSGFFLYMETANTSQRDVIIPMITGIQVIGLDDNTNFTKTGSQLQTVGWTDSQVRVWIQPQYIPAYGRDNPIFDDGKGYAVILLTVLD